MDAERFYEIIDRARGEGAGPKTPSADEDRLREVLNGESNEAVAAFALRYDGELMRLNRWSVWGAGYVIYGGMSDDSFHYFRSWLVGKGREAVETAMTDPDGLGAYVEDPEEVDNEGLEYVAIELLQGRGVEEDPRDAYDENADDDPEGEPFDEETVAGIYPRLAAGFG